MVDRRSLSAGLTQPITVVWQVEPVSDSSRTFEEKLMGGAGFHTEIFFIKSESDFKPDFSRVKVTDFSAAIAR